MVTVELSAFGHAPYINIDAPLPERKILSKIAEFLKKRHKDTTTDAGAAVVKNEDRSGSTKAAQDFHMSPKAVVALKAFLHAIKTLSSVYIDGF